MCLCTIDKTEVQDKFKNSIPEEGFVVYKVVESRNGKNYPPYANTTTPYEEGINDAVTAPIRRTSDKKELYIAGFHFWASKKIAEEHAAFLIGMWGDKGTKVIEVTIKKEWITTIGTQLADDKKERVIVTNKAIFPAYEEKE